VPFEQAARTGQALVDDHLLAAAVGKTPDLWRRHQVKRRVVTKAHADHRVFARANRRRQKHRRADLPHVVGAGADAGAVLLAGQVA
jgi:hypothetical protein